PDALAAAAGSIRGGGLLVLLTPALADWPGAPDAALDRLIPAGRGRGEAGARFVERLIGCLRSAPGIERYGPDDAPPSLVPGPPAAAGPEHGYGCRSADQRNAVEAVVGVVTGHRRRPAVLSADRGRGKSAALGIAAGELLRRGRVRRVSVTAPSLTAAEPVLEHAAAYAAGTFADRRTVRIGAGELAFREPEAVLERAGADELVLVDEAAGLPVALLTALLRGAPRIAFATTVHGYEGTGRGFDLRFRAVLDAETPQWRAVRLDTPIRWAPGDPLEAWLARALLLDADPGEPDPPGPDDALRVEALDRDALAADEPRLRQLFGLLVSAHYRTRPLDLRQLLDAPGIHLLGAVCGGECLGVALAAEEGGLDAETARQVWAGRRRPQGHLLPQMLATHAGLEAAPRQR
ncbi:tRNA(Met) cytidine acetyltransferase TmcA domain-containing protein, partial [Halorhodospira neutriphila]